ncbi:MAG: mechanosensitive ion channel [Candidatus Sungbacteria bacterium]|nr:mechanosensitive ion channel [Candidatus Sungbacteria bacterium]
MEIFTDIFNAERVVSYGWKIAAVLVLLLIFKSLFHEVVKKLVSHGSTGRRRAATLAGVLTAMGDVVLYFIIILLGLRFFGFDTTPILAGAGIVGLAVGFGAQSLVKDFIAGLLILFENQYNIGDMVQIGNAEGVVARMTVRSTVLRDDQGKLYFIPNGSIVTVINLSRAPKK